MYFTLEGYHLYHYLTMCNSPRRPDSDPTGVDWYEACTMYPSHDVWFIKYTGSLRNKIDGRLSAQAAQEGQIKE